ncbi:MAG: hypothetical protein WBO19_14320, partial [Terriglobia bacterium]
MPDALSERHSDLLQGSYDCVDRIVLNAYFPLGHSPGGFGTHLRNFQSPILGIFVLALTFSLPRAY